MSLNARGSARGLDVWWKPREVVSQYWMAYDRNLIGRFRYLGTKDFVFLSVVYNPQGTWDKKVSWKQLQKMKQMIGNALWFVGGYFNIIRSLEEKKGGIHKLDQSSSNFDGIIDTAPCRHSNQ